MQKKLQNYMNDLGSHPVFHNDYFKIANEIKLTPEFYAMHRANFFYRTMTTVMGIAHIVGAAASHRDQDTLTSMSYILNEECGDGKKSRCHEVLMEQAHNTYGHYEFDLPPLIVKDLDGRHDSGQDGCVHHLIVEETKDYRTKINFLLAKNYPTMLGVAYAIEKHASPMLTIFRKMFGVNRKNMDKADYLRSVDIYFSCHLDNGVEHRHAEDTRQCLLNNCISESELDDIIFGIEEFFKIQHAMWNGMYRHARRLI